MFVTQRKYDEACACYRGHLADKDWEIAQLKLKAERDAMKWSGKVAKAQCERDKALGIAEGPIDKEFRILWHKGATTVKAATMRLEDSTVVFRDSAGNIVGSCPVGNIVVRIEEDE